MTAEVNPLKYFSHLPKGLGSRRRKAYGGPETTRAFWNLNSAVLQGKAEAVLVNKDTVQM